MDTAVSHKKLHILAIITLILLVGTAVRTIGIHSISPPGIEHDEVANWLIDRSILDEGNFAVYYTRAYGHEAVFHYIQALSLALIGDSPFALRLPAMFAGVLGIAVTFAIAKKLFDENVALLAAGLLAILFWPVFYGRLGLRAIWLPVFSGLSFYFFWKGWQGSKRGLISFFVAGIFAGLGVNTYLAGRVVPIFYGLFVAYLAVFHWAQFKRTWRGILLFSVVFGAVCLPLVLFLQNNPNAEFRVAEVAAPLEALRAGNFEPVLQNGFKILGMFGVAGDPVWRQNVAGQPVFEPVMAILFYTSVGYVLWRWRDARFAFLLLWLGTAVIPSLVTIDAPSNIRIINALVVITIFPALLIHKLFELSTDSAKLSTRNHKFALTILIFMFSLLYLGRTTRDVFFVWPVSDEIPFVWQSAFRNVAQYLDESGDNTAVSLAGWSPETMDSPSMTLLRQNDDIAISHFNPQDGSLIIPADRQIFRPTDLPLDPYWETQLAEWGAEISQHNLFTQYATGNTPSPQFPQAIHFGDELLFSGYDLVDGQMVTYWQVTAVPTSARQLFIHYLDGEGNLLGESYHFDRQDPQGLWFPHWQMGDLILQLDTLPAETDQIRLGWFNPYSCSLGTCQNLPTDDDKEFVLIDIRH